MGYFVLCAVKKLLTHSLTYDVPDVASATEILAAPLPHTVYTQLHR